MQIAILSRLFFLPHIRWLEAVASPRVIRGVLANFLGTYTSRYSDFDGYWLFGYLVDDWDALRIDLLKYESADLNTPRGFAMHSATTKFAEQINKSGLAISQIHDAGLMIERLPSPERQPVNGRPSDGYNYKFTVFASMQNGKRYERVRVHFIAPHNSKVELRSTRAG